ncbi:F-box/LRR-repeat protein 6-like [Physella acuta]|uniref:F-box/LRR-repeat protein 6-like n=1 Tax=Physella acuta TaxID=109671 RepID=UPI0027DD90F1|nr:F-box/LRR-repeat protein 6-like [Physella acuta]
MTPEDEASTRTKLSVHKETFWLPPEILVKIFSFCIAAEGIIKFIPRASRVCKEWHRATREASLFEYLDLSIEVINLKNAKLDGILSYDLSLCKNLNLAGQTKLSSSVIESLLTNTPGLVTLNLFSCGKVQPELVSRLPQLCTSLRRVDISNPLVHTGEQGGPGFRSLHIESLISGCGARLVEVRLAGVIGFFTVKKYACSFFKALQDNCPNLEELDVRMSPRFSLKQIDCKVDMRGFVESCPKLKELRIDGINLSDGKGKDQPYSGPKHLKFYSQSSLTTSPSDKAVFYLMFASVTKLIELDISSTNLLPGVITKWVKAVDCLNLADMKWKVADSNNLYECLDSWIMSIKVLDLSNNKLKSNALDSALNLYAVVDDPNFQGYPLKHLNISKTNITAKTVKQIISACKNLEEIDLTSCRELPRGSKRIFHKKEFNTLLRCLCLSTTEQGCSDEEESEEYISDN